MFAEADPLRRKDSWYSHTGVYVQKHTYPRLPSTLSRTLRDILSININDHVSPRQDLFALLHPTRLLVPCPRTRANLWDTRTARVNSTRLLTSSAQLSKLETKARYSMSREIRRLRFHCRRIRGSVIRIDKDIEVGTVEQNTESSRY